jgi:hypothetical protein
MPKRRNTTTVRHSSSSASGQETEVARLTRELDEARELQAATGEVLRVISISPHDIQPVFDAIAENAARICQGQFAFVVRFDDASGRRPANSIQTLVVAKLHNHKIDRSRCCRGPDGVKLISARRCIPQNGDFFHSGDNVAY